MHFSMLKKAHINSEIRDQESVAESRGHGDTEEREINRMSFCLVDMDKCRSKKSGGWKSKRSRQRRKRGSELFGHGKESFRYRG